MGSAREVASTDASLVEEFALSRCGHNIHNMNEVDFVKDRRLACPVVGLFDNILLIERRSNSGEPHIAPRPNLARPQLT